MLPLRERIERAHRTLTDWGEVDDATPTVPAHEVAALAGSGDPTRQITVLMDEIERLRGRPLDRVAGEQYQELADIIVALLDRLDAASPTPPEPRLGAQALMCRLQLIKVLEDARRLEEFGEDARHEAEIRAGDVKGVGMRRFDGLANLTIDLAERAVVFLFRLFGGLEFSAERVPSPTYTCSHIPAGCRLAHLHTRSNYSLSHGIYDVSSACPECGHLALRHANGEHAYPAS